METVIRKWGNSPALRLPGSVLKQAGYRLEQKVELVVSRNRIVVRPAQTLEYDLQTLVEGITPENRHDAVSTGPARGKEAL